MSPSGWKIRSSCFRNDTETWMFLMMDDINEGFEIFVLWNCSVSEIFYVADKWKLLVNHLKKKLGKWPACW